VKGGHGPGPICRDCLVLKEGKVHWFATRRIKTRNTHGTGCVLSAAIAVELGRGRSLHAAVETARGFLQRALLAGWVVPWGRGGGPAFAGT
jgi:hydroxymethylpyrimidine/phosphomethylpyrimidine kinase